MLYVSIPIYLATCSPYELCIHIDECRVHNLLLLPIHIARPCDPSVLYLFSGCHNYFDHCKATKYTVSVVI